MGTFSDTCKSNLVTMCHNEHNKEKLTFIDKKSKICKNTPPSLPSLAEPTALLIKR